MVSGTCNITTKFQSIFNISIRRIQDTCMIGFEGNITWTISEDRYTCLWSLAIIHTRNNTNISFFLLTTSSFPILNSLICRSCGHYGLTRSDIQSLLLLPMLGSVRLEQCISTIERYLFNRLNDNYMTNCSYQRLPIR